MIEPEHAQLSVARQCVLLGLPRASYYYQPRPETEENLAAMRLIDEQYTKTPFYGARRMVASLESQGLVADRKRVRRLMMKMGLEAIYPKPRLSLKAPEHRIYPYLLNGVTARGPNHI